MIRTEAIEKAIIES